MEVLWSAPTPLTARVISDELRDRELAKTTVLTVLSRLEKKGRVTRSREDWAHTYAATASREDYVAELMHDALEDASDRSAALVRFVSNVSPDEAQALQSALVAATRSKRSRTQAGQ
ncbi:MAG: transcriptional regulator [Corynebacteriales bacterium]|nr:transcriptional regulator [Mycobacteriales bacterium]